MNAELIRLYWDIGKIIDERQKKEGWGSSVIPKLAKELSGELSEIKGFSSRNLDRMIAFYRTYSDIALISPPPVAKLELNPTPHSFWLISWTHHTILMEKIRSQKTRFWYIEQISKNGWSRRTLQLQIQNKIHERQGKAITNFEEVLSETQSALAAQTLKDPYIFDFLTLENTFHERELEVNLLKHLQEFLLELGQGFAFVGRQYSLNLGENEYYIDLLFYHLKLRCFIVIELKRGKFKAEYAGKMNLYLNIVDDTLKHKDDTPSIGLILCQDKNQIEAEYTLRGSSRPIGISEYELTRSLPQNLKSVLPTIEEIESELKEKIKGYETDPSEA